MLGLSPEQYAFQDVYHFTVGARAGRPAHADAPPLPRRDARANMNIQIERPHVEALMARFPAHSGLSSQLALRRQSRTRSCASLRRRIRFPRRALSAIGSRIARPSRAARDVALGAASLRASASRQAISKTFCRRWSSSDDRRHSRLAVHGERRRQGRCPMSSTRFDYVPPSNDEAGKILIELKANAKGALQSNAHAHHGRATSSAERSAKSSPPRVSCARRPSSDRGLRRGERDAISTGAAATARSFPARAPAFTPKIPTPRIATRTGRARTSSCSRRAAARRASSTTKASCRARSLTLEAPGDMLGHYLRKAGKSNRFAAEDEVAELREQIPPGLFTHVPVHPYILMFHLDLHHYVWVHVDDMQPYRYQPELKEQAGAAAGADRSHRHPDRRNGRADGRHRRRQVRRHHGALRRPARRRQDADRRGLFGDHPAPALPRAFRPARASMSAQWRRR